MPRAHVTGRMRARRAIKQDASALEGSDSEGGFDARARQVKTHAQKYFEKLARQKGSKSAAAKGLSSSP